MKKLKYVIAALLLVVFACKEDDSPASQPLSNLTVSSEQDGATVNITATAQGASSYSFDFGDGTTAESLTGYVVKTYDMVGDNTYTVAVTAFDSSGASVSENIQVSISISAEVPEEINILTGGTSKTWFLASSQPGHLGVGPAREGIDGDWWYPKWYSAQAFEKCNDEISDCLCDDELTFSIDASGEVSYVLNNNGQTFFNAGHLAAGGGTGDEDMCIDFDSSGSKAVTVSSVSGNVPDSETTGIQLDLADGGFMGYYVGSSTYEILSITETTLHVRTYDTEDADLAWYHRFSSESSEGGGGDETLDTEFTNLVWADEFDVDGAPNPANWTYDLGAGGWGNNESQTYTDNPENVRVEDGLLKITAKSLGGSAVSHYFDDITLTDGSTDVAVQDFEGTAPAFVGFGGVGSGVIDNPDASGENTSSKVGESSKGLGAETWGGSFFDVAAPLDLSTYGTITMKTWSPAAGQIIKMKLENQANSDEAFEVDATTTVANGWETLTYDFSAAPSFTYNRVVLFFDFGNSPEGGITSARIKSENLYEFTYGRVEIRAKMPSAGGTWPALWTLGANFEQVGWPTCGEMDILEHVGNNVGRVSSALHYPGNSGGTAVVGATNVATTTSEFHNYTMEWTADSIKFVVDDELIHLDYTNASDTPFNADFFFIMNIAMGGTLGGAIDPAFTEDTMEVDYIRVYQ